MRARQVPGVVAIAVGVALCALALAAPGVSLGAYEHHLESVGTDGDATAHDELPAETQAVLEELYEDGEKTIHGRENVPETLLEEAMVNGGEGVVVDHDGERYLVGVEPPGEPIGVGFVYLWLFFGGLAVAGVGYVDAREGLVRLSSAATVAGLYVIYRLLTSPAYAFSIPAVG